ncbi:MAG TPA: response regulator transcription factor [Solimonas sp.]|nr:response regulator transcription factor [Solimonas sp.]
MQIMLLVACGQEHSALALCTQVVQGFAGRIAAEAVVIGGVLHRAAATQPDVLLLEHTDGEEENSWRLLSELGRVSASTRVLLLCDAYTHLTIIGFIQRGVSGCLLKSNDVSLYAKAVSTVHRGETWFGRNELLQAIRSQIIAEPAVTAAVLDNQELLTAREREILALIGNALTNKEIARELKISDHTVKTHLHRIYVKLHRSGRYKAFLSEALGSPAPGWAISREIQLGDAGRA